MFFAAKANHLPISKYSSVGQAPCGPGGAVSRIHLEEGTSVEELPPSKWLEGMSVGPFLDLYGCGRAYPQS